MQRLGTALLARLIQIFTIIQYQVFFKISSVQIFDNRTDNNPLFKLSSAVKKSGERLAYGRANFCDEEFFARFEAESFYEGFLR